MEIPVEICTGHERTIPVEICTNEKLALEDNNNLVYGGGGPGGESHTLECDGLGEGQGEGEYLSYEEEEEVMADDFDAELFDP